MLQLCTGFRPPSDGITCNPYSSRNSIAMDVVYSGAMLVGIARPTALSSNRIISSSGVHKEFNSSRSRVLHNGVKLIYSATSNARRSPLAHGIRGSIQESGHDNPISVYADAASPNWQPSNLAFVHETNMKHSILDTNDVSRPKIDIDEVPLVILPIVRTYEKKKLGLSAEMVRRISEHNSEPEWMLQFRLDAFHQLLAMDEPQAAHCPPIDLHAMYSTKISAPDHQQQPQHLEDIVGAVYESNGDSFATTHKEALADAGVIFCSISDAIREHPELVRKHLGKVVAPSDNFYAALNSAVFFHGSFCYVPKNVKCPMDISTNFLVDGRKMTSPFERTLIVCGENAFVSSLGCTSPPLPNADGATKPGQQLHAPVIELFCAAGGEIKHVTVHNWLEAGATLLARQIEQEERLCNFVTKRGLCEGARSKITWTIVDAGSGVTWLHPAVVLKGDGSVGECFSVTLTTARQEADTGATMIHSGSQTRSRIVSKTISAGASRSCFRGVVHVEPWSRNARSEAHWDAVLIGDHAETTSGPSVVARNTTAEIEAKGSISKISKEQVFYFQQRGIQEEKAVPAILTGFCDAVLRELPHEFESEVREMVAMKIEEFVKGSFATSAP